VGSGKHALSKNGKGQIVGPGPIDAFPPLEPFPPPTLAPGQTYNILFTTTVYLVPVNTK
jgi:hypothetical protein